METEEKNILDIYIGQLIKILYKDGESFRTIRGKYMDSSNLYVQIQTLKQPITINHKDITKISVSDGE